METKGKQHFLKERKKEKNIYVTIPGRVHEITEIFKSPKWILDNSAPPRFNSMVRGWQKALPVIGSGTSLSSVRSAGSERIHLSPLLNPSASAVSNAADIGTSEDPWHEELASSGNALTFRVWSCHR